jgi:hypothetical protein
VLLEKITDQANAIFPGVKIKTEYSHEESTRARYTYLPPVYYKVLTLTNLNPETQRLSTYWNKAEERRYSKECIKIFYPIGSDAQLPYVMTEETSDPTVN